MINTLILAYVSGSLPLLLALYLSPIPLHILINQENVSTEIFRITIGSIGLLLAIPITTLVSVYLIDGSENSGAHGHHHHH